MMQIVVGADSLLGFGLPKRRIILTRGLGLVPTDGNQTKKNAPFGSGWMEAKDLRPMK
ncbi:hypothetical protein LXL04_035265 [Taraxacum kok-saghyz]